jgi:putrescine aminotransferase
MGEEPPRRHFEPLLGDCTRVPFGDLGALERALATRRVAGFLVDPLLCEAGVAVPPAGYLRQAQDLCRKHGALLLLDEVQTGLGRTGDLFAYQHEGLVPDVLCLAKSLSGGIMPIGATLTTRALHERAYGAMDRFNLHASTFGGNSLSCVAALETLAILDEERLADNARARGDQLASSLRARLAGHPLVREVRGRGLLVGIELGPAERGWASRLAAPLVARLPRGVFGQWAAVKLLERGVICQPANHSWNVLKVEPPLTIQPAEIDAFVAAIGAVLDEYQGVTPLLADVTERLGKQFLAGWGW